MMDKLTKEEKQAHGSGLYIVYWLDSCSDNAWHQLSELQLQDNADLKLKPSLTRTVGYVRKRDDESLEIWASKELRDNPWMSGLMIIPTGSVLAAYELKIGKKAKWKTLNDD